MIDAMHLALAMAATCSAPLDVGIWTHVAARAHSVEPIVLAGYVCSEHRDGRWSGQCSDHGACGPFQLVATWPRAAGVHDAARMWTPSAAVLAAGVVRYSQRRHRQCTGTHGWRAHVKCGPGGRDDCAHPVRRWHEAERSVLDAHATLRRGIDATGS